MKYLTFAIALFALAVGSALAAENNRPNVLFIAVDDLRPELACYGKEKMHTPNIDRLAKTGVLFNRAYCMVPTCGASRASLMTGIRPSRNRFVTYLTRADKDAPGITTMNTLFNRNGYATSSLGKIFHHATDNAVGWSQPAWRPKGGFAYQTPENQKLHNRRQKQKGRRKRGPAYESAKAPEDAYPDGRIADKAISELKRLKKGDKPFFMAVGFMKPHLPFVCPKKYWDLYDEKEIHLPPTYHRPKNAPKEAIHTSGELRAYAGIPAKGPVSDETARKLIHGYYACVSFTDAQVGKVLDELDRLELSKNTIVVLWGDHGWNLGEHTLWCKHSCFETSMQIPIIVKAPGISPGQKTNGLTETIDIYPSLCELADLPKPAHLAGRSFVPLLNNPNQPWKTAAVGRFNAGDTIRTDHYRFSEYGDKMGRIKSNMLYDHHTDPAEDNNISVLPNNTELIDKLSKQLFDIKGK